MSSLNALREELKTQLNAPGNVDWGCILKTATRAKRLADESVRQRALDELLNPEKQEIEVLE